jgi:hypothetical protein
METDEALQSATLTQRVVLVSLAALSREGTPPFDPTDVRSACDDRFRDPDGPVVGRVSEADVMSALNELGASDLLEEVDREDTSPVGKGRPTYALAVDPGTVLEAYAADERIGDAVASLDE